MLQVLCCYLMICCILILCPVTLGISSQKKFSVIYNCNSIGSKTLILSLRNFIDIIRTCSRIPFSTNITYLSTYLPLRVIS